MGEGLRPRTALCLRRQPRQPRRFCGPAFLPVFPGRALAVGLSPRFPAVPRALGHFCRTPSSGPPPLRSRLACLPPRPTPVPTGSAALCKRAWPLPPPRPCGGIKRLPLKNDAAWRGNASLTLSWAQLFAAWEGPLAPSSSFVPGYDLMLTSRFLDHPGLGALLQEALEMFLALDAAMGKGGQGHRRWSAGPRKEHAPRVTAAWIRARLAAPLTC